MKLTAGILSLFFLVWSIEPCLEIASESDSVQDQVSQTQCEDDQGEDSCATCCDCQCCVVHFIGYQLFQFDPDTPETCVTSFAYSEQKGQDVLLSFLQPPRD